MRIRIVTINNVVFDLNVKEKDIDIVTSKVFNKDFIKVNQKTIISTKTIAIIQQLD